MSQIRAAWNGRIQGDVMGKVVGILALSALSFVVFFSVGSACGTGYRERGGFGGCSYEVGRQFGVLMSAGTKSDGGGSFTEVSKSGGSAASQPAVISAGNAASQPVSWRQVTYWTGRGNKDTEAFLINRPEWRIIWTAKGGASASAESLRVAV